jgi:hypothetical protein
MRPLRLLSAEPGSLGHAGQAVLWGEDDQGLGHCLLHTPAVRQAYGEHQAVFFSRMYTRSKCCGPGMFILDPSFFHPGSKFCPSRIRIKELKYFNPKNFFQAPGNMIRVVHPRSGSWFFQIQGSKRPRICNTARSDMQLFKPLELVISIEAMVVWYSVVKPSYWSQSRA